MADVDFEVGDVMEGSEGKSGFESVPGNTGEGPAKCKRC